MLVAGAINLASTEAFDDLLLLLLLRLLLILPLLRIIAFYVGRDFPFGIKGFFGYRKWGIGERDFYRYR